MRLLSLIVLTVLATSSSLLSAEALPPAPEPGELRVMSFNIRYGTAKDGPDHWDKRKDLVADTIKKYAPDLLGTQETLDFQAAYLREKLPEYTFIGAGRDDGKSGGEMAALFFRTDRFEKLVEGHFWLSETPETVGSKGWDAALPRITTWVKLKEKSGPKTGRVFYFFNTHFDHMGKQARVESAKLIRQKIAALGEATVVLTGDFNSGEGSEPYKEIVGKAGAGPLKPQLIDSYRAVHPKPGQEDGTMNNFKGGRSSARIDWIVHTSGLTAVNGGIDHTEREGRFPSDHYPIYATLK